jgi:hypothetical protein
MSTTPASSGDGLEVVVGSDGNLMVSAAELSRHGVRPGAHLRLVVDEQEPPPKRKSTMGALADKFPPDVIDDLIRGLDEAKVDRIKALGLS